MFERFTDRARRVVVLAQEEARLLNHNYIGTEHILLALIREGEGVAAKALESLGISLEAVRQRVEEIIGQGQQAPSGHIPLTPRARKVLELSLREALQLGHNYIGTEHILLGLIGEGDGVAAQVLVKLGADLNRVRQQVIYLLHGYQGKEPVPIASGAGEPLPSTLGRLDHFERIIDAIAEPIQAMHEAYPIIGREKELDLAIQALSRPLRNNPILVSESSAATQAVLAEIAKYTERNDSPGTTGGKKIYWISNTMLRAHAGDFEDSLTRVTKEAQARPDVLLYIEDVHDLLSNKKIETNSPAIISFRAALNRRSIQIIGSTTPELYRQHFAADAFARRNFQVIHLPNMDATEAASFLKRTWIGRHGLYRTTITDEALRAAASLALYFTRSNSSQTLHSKLQLFLNARSKAIALLASSFPSPPARDLTAKIKEIQAAKEAAIDEQDFEAAAAHRETEKELYGELRALTRDLDEGEVFAASAAIFGMPPAEVRRLADRPGPLALEVPAELAAGQMLRQAADELGRHLGTRITDGALRAAAVLGLHACLDDVAITTPPGLPGKPGETTEPDQRMIEMADTLVALASQQVGKSDLEANIRQIRTAKEAAIDEQDFEAAAAHRETEKELVRHASQMAVDEAAVFAAASDLSGLAVAKLRQLAEEFTPAAIEDVEATVEQPYTLLNDEPVESARGDLLGTDSVAGGIASLLATSRLETPFVLAIDASWGMGKSTLLRQIESRLVSYPGLATVRFNAWTAKDASALEGLIKSVLVELDPNVIRRWVRKLPGRRRALVLAGIGFGLVARFIGVPRLVDELWTRLAVDARSRNELREVIRGMLTDWVNAGDSANPRRTLVAFVDDLDRCSDEAIVQVCEAVKLYLDAPGLIFIFACDLSVIARGGPLSRDGSESAGRAYLEKIVQVVHRLPPPDEGQLTELIQGYARRSGTAALIDKTITRILIESAGRNPRRIKRIINSIVLENRLNPAWSLPPLSRTQLVVAILLQHLYMPFYEALVDEAADGDPIGTFLDYVAVRSRLPVVPQPDNPWWATAEHLFSKYDMPLDASFSFSSESLRARLDALEDRLPRGFPALADHPGLVTLLRQAGDGQARTALRFELLRRPLSAEPGLESSSTQADGQPGLPGSVPQGT
ncbi:MAG TPA: Clp protease N-terminal domain-containing protein [Trebonia sp.]|nr:Clp protease N-terminal domain-containing protein [Trebonia sp.]